MKVTMKLKLNNKMEEVLSIKCRSKNDSFKCCFFSEEVCDGLEQNNEDRVCVCVCVTDTVTVVRESAGC